MTLFIRAAVERWPIAGKFVISRGSRTEAAVVVVDITDGHHEGRGECVPYPRYGETLDSVLAEIAAVQPDGLDREALRRALHPGSARNAIDCALWDLEAKRTRTPAWQLAGVQPMQSVETAYTLSLGDPESMAEAAERASERPLLKLKLGGDGDPARIRAVRAAAPGPRLVVDANEAWTKANFSENMRACTEAGVLLVEQPLPAGADEALRHLPRDVPVCADESVHISADLDGLAGKYDAVNVKLDKAGGLTEALELVREARRRDFRIMVGCMVGTSLAMAPAFLLAQDADIVDLDGPLLLAEDREPGLVYRGSVVEPPGPALWG